MPSLRVLSRQTVAKPIEAKQTVLCSPHELIAIVTHTHDVFVYRLNGQIAFTIKNLQDEDDIEAGEAPLKVTSAQWSPDGRRLVIAWSDGTWRIHEAEKGEAIFDSSVRNAADEQDTSYVVGASWETYRTDDTDVLTAFIRQAGLHGNESKDDAAFLRSVTLFDSTSVLPRLSALPSHGLRSSAESVRFATQAATDSVFAPAQKNQDRSVEVLLLQTSLGDIRVMLHGTSLIGSAKCESAALRSCFTSNASAAISIDMDSPRALHVLDIPVQKLNSTTLQLASQSITQLTALLQYVRRTVQCINHDYTTGIALPARFMKAITMTLEDNLASNSTLISTLLQLCLTGQMHSDLLEWLTDIVKDTGLKRWDVSVNTMYASIQMHLHSHVLPALDRLSIATTKLRGLAKLHQGSAVFQPEEKLFSTILDAVDTLRRATMRTLETSIGEWALWRTFARAMKVWIEMATAGPNTKEATETEERESLGLNYYAVMQYIRTVLDHGSDLRHIVNGSKERDLSILTNSIEQAIQSALASVTAWQSRMFTSTRDIALDRSPHTVYDSWAGASIVKLLVGDEDGTTRLVRYDLDNMALATQNLVHGIVEWEMNDVADAKLYDEGRSLLYILSESIGDNAELQLVSRHLETGQEMVKHEIQDTTLAGMLVSGRRGKEFCVLLSPSKGPRHWTVLDLHTADKV